MARYIDADRLKRQMEFVCMGIMSGTDPYNAPLNTIDEAPTADVVPVVRCKDCIHHKNAHKTMYVWCECVDGLLPHDWFCADGERREDD